MKRESGPIHICKTDAELLARLHRAGFGADAWTEEACAALLRDPSVCALLAEADGGMAAAGFILLRDMREEAEILTLAVTPEFRRRGVAAALLARAEAEMAQRGVREMWLETACGNAAALALYRRMGYAACGQRPGYYARADGRREDALLMRKEIRVPAD